MAGVDSGYCGVERWWPCPSFSDSAFGRSEFSVLDVRGCCVTDGAVDASGVVEAFDVSEEVRGGVALNVQLIPGAWHRTCH